MFNSYHNKKPQDRPQKPRKKLPRARGFRRRGPILLVGTLVAPVPCTHREVIFYARYNKKNLKA